MDYPQEMSSRTENSELNKLRERVVNLESELSSARHSNQNLRSDLEYIRHNAVLKSTHDEVLEQNRTIAQNNVTLICKNEELLKKAEELQQTEATLRSETSRVLSKNLTLQSDIAKLKIELVQERGSHKATSEDHKVIVQKLQKQQGLVNNVNTQKAELQKQILGLTSDLQTVREKLHSLTTENERLQNENKAISSVRESEKLTLQKDNSNLKNELETEKEKRDKVKEHYKDLNQKYDIVCEKFRKADETVKDDQVQMKKLKEELSSLKSHHADVCQLRDELGIAGKQILKLKTDLQAALVQVNSLNTENLDLAKKNETFSKQTKRLENENNKHRKENKVIAENNKELVNQNKKLRETAENQQQVAAALREERDKTLSENVILREDNVELKREIQNCKEADKAHQVAVQKLETQLSSTITQKTEVERQILVLKKNWQAENDEFSKKNKSLSVLNQNLSVQNRKLNSLNQLLEKKKTSLENLNHTKERENNELRKQQQQLESKNQKGSSKLHEAVTQIKVLEGERNALQQEKREAVAKNEHRIRILNEKLETNKSLHDQVTKELKESIDKERGKLVLVGKNCDELTKIKKELLQSVKNLKGNVEMCQGKISTLEEQKTLAETSHKTELEMLQQKLDTATSDIQILNSTLKSSCDQVKLLEDQNNQLLAKASSLEMSNQNLADTNKVVDNLNTNLSETNQVLEKLNKDLLEKNTSLSDLNVDLESGNHTISEKNDALVNDNMKLTEKVRYSEDENNKLQKENQEINRNYQAVNEKLRVKSSLMIQNLHAKDEKIKSLQKQVADLEQESEKKSGSIADIRKKKQRTDAELEKLRRQVNSMNTQRKRLISEHDMITKSDSVKYERLNESNRKLKGEIEELKKTLQESTVVIVAQKEQINQQQRALAEQGKSVKVLEEVSIKNYEILKTLEEHLQTAEEHIKKLDIQLKNREADNSKLQWDLNEMRYKIVTKIDPDERELLQKKEAEIAAANANINRLEEELGKCKSYNFEACSLTERLNRERTELKEMLETKSRKLKVANEDIDHLEDKLDEKSKVIRKQQKDLKDFESSFTYMCVELAELKSENERLQSSAKPKQNSGERDDEFCDKLPYKKPRMSK